MPICHDYELVRPLLLADEPATRSIYNLVFRIAGAAARWVRVDNLSQPKAVLCRSGAPYRSRFMYLYGTDSRAAQQLLAELPARWRFQFAATPLRFVRVARRVRKLNWVAPCYLYILNPEQLVHYRRHRIERLKPDDARQIVHFWPHGRSLNYVRWRIETGPTCAIRRNGRLVAWGLTHADGSMGMLHVLQEYRGQGMARSITTALAGAIIRQGRLPFLYILRRNRPSINLTESMGFQRAGSYCWFGE